jgi:hypothetical protein
MTVKIPSIQPPPGATGDGPNGQGPDVKITPYVARQKVNAFVIMEISDLMRGGQPELVVGDRLCWSVPVVLGFPGRGIVGKVGEILVDATTGELLIEKDTVQRMSDDADRLAERASL